MPRSRHSTETATLTAADSGIGWMPATSGIATLSISGTFVATVTLQRRFGADGPALDVKSYTAPAEENIECAADMELRLYIKAGNYTSGSCVCRLSQRN